MRVLLTALFISLSVFGKYKAGESYFSEKDQVIITLMEIGENETTIRIHDAQGVEYEKPWPTADLDNLIEGIAKAKKKNSAEVELIKNDLKVKEEKRKALMKEKQATENEIPSSI